MTKIISQKTLISGKYFDLVENKIDFGNNITREHVDYYEKDAISVFPINDNYEVFLVKQYRYLLGKETLEAVAGIIDGDENPIEAAERELKEEIGVVAKDYDKFKDVYLAASFVKSKHHLILAKNLSFEDSSPEETENTVLVKLSLDDAIDKINKGEINTAVTVIGILLLDKIRQGVKI